MLETTRKIKLLLEKKNFILDRGISESRLKEIEEKLEITFPPDLSDLLCNYVPRGKEEIDLRFPDWNKGKLEKLKDRTDSWISGFLFDVENNNFWVSEWGQRPENSYEQVEVAKAELKKAPKLIPIFGHRFIPSIPNESGLPVFSIHQSDIIVYGEDLLSYFENELSQWQQPKLTPRMISFWTNLLNIN